MIDKESNEEELPKLSIEQENEFKKIKLSLENDAIFGGSSKKLPPEIEGQFLDYISNFENAYQNAKPISVFEKIGSPEFKLEVTLSDNEINVELERIMNIMNQNGLDLSILADYENENRLIYSFITKELFLHEIDDMNMPGMVTNFTYEEFHPNHEYDLKRDTEDFLKMFLNIKSEFYDEYHRKDATNHEVLNNFRSLFEKFELKFFEFKNIDFDEQNAKVAFNIDFLGRIQGTKAETLYSGDGSITFEHEYGYWYVREVILPVNI